MSRRFLVRVLALLDDPRLPATDPFRLELEAEVLALLAVDSPRFRPPPRRVLPS